MDYDPITSNNTFRHFNKCHNSVLQSYYTKDKSPVLGARLTCL